MTVAAVPPTREVMVHSVGRDDSLGKITTRPSVAEDSAFMLELYASTSKEALDDLGWTIGSQRTFVIMQAQTEEWNRARLYPGMDRLTICVDDLPVGRLLVCMRNSILHLVDLSLLPRYRGLGIGTQLICEIIEEARNAGVPVKVKVKVLKDSSAVRFVDRLGFTAPTDLGRHVELTWMPPLSAGPDDREDGFTSHGTRANRAAPEGESSAGASMVESWVPADDVSLDQGSAGVEANPAKPRDSLDLSGTDLADVDLKGPVDAADVESGELTDDDLPYGSDRYDPFA